MMMGTGQKPIKTSKQGQFQIIDVVEMMRPLTKYTRQVVSGSNIPSRVREAFRLAEEERPGAVHLELPEDIAAEEVEALPFPKDRVRRPIAEEKAIFRAVEMIEQAQRPLLLVGAGANRKRTSQILSRFIDEPGFPSSARRWARVWSTSATPSFWEMRRYRPTTTSTAPSNGRI